ncbi:hypothetical protein [Bosea sp. CS1GBMeth4]|uniref:hypothetical protein n=1 Tax=Bosea sp. CS1GBMeth4 TaxID=1892849 RepID=UPI0016492C9D|nr:hypothetical protein [Bosea sp. CS1GBMeth4]
MVELRNAMSGDGRENAGMRPLAEEGGQSRDTLKEFGVDTDRMVEAASESARTLQDMLADEVRARPLRALGWAAAIGLVVGVIAAR